MNIALKMYICGLYYNSCLYTRFHKDIITKVDSMTVVNTNRGCVYMGAMSTDVYMPTCILYRKFQSITVCI